MARRARQLKSSATILLVEDDVPYADATRMLLERDGYEVLIATNGIEALDLLRERSIDLVLLDYVMPRMTGEQVVQELPWRWKVQGRIFLIGGLGFMFDAWDVTLNGIRSNSTTW